MSPRRNRFEQLRITPGAFFVIATEIGFSLIWLLSSLETRAKIGEWAVSSPTQVFGEAKVWTILTSNFLEPSFITLLLHAVMMWAFVPTLERFWGTPRFIRFFAVTTIVAQLAGLGMGYLTGRDVPITGIGPFIFSTIIAFGIIYARQQVHFFGVLPLTGRQLMYGFSAFQLLFIVLQQFWELGAAIAAAAIAAVIICSKKTSPGLAWKRWRLARARKKLSVIDGGKKPKGRDEQKWLN